MDLDKYVGVGIQSQQLSVIVSTLSHVAFSEVGIVFGSPDVQPAVFLAMMASTAQAQIMRSRGGNATNPNVPGLEPKLVSTILALTVISTMMLGIIFYLLAKLRWTRILELLPAAVMHGFMGSVGYTILSKGVMLSMPLEPWVAGPLQPIFWTLLMPAVILGLIMYLRDRYKLGKPIIVVPLLMILPLAVFCAVAFSSSEAQAKARKDGWLFRVKEQWEPPARIFALSYGSAQLVDWGAVRACLPTLILMCLVVPLDFLLKIAAIRKNLQLFDMSMDEHVAMTGKSNLVCGLLVGAPGYAQLAITRISSGVVKKNDSRFPSFMTMLINLALFISGFPLEDYIPRFWLSGLLIYAGLDFVVDNLFDSRNKLSMKEFVAVFVIVIVNAIAGLGWSVLASVVLSTLIFAIEAAKGGCVKAVYSGVSFRSSTERSTKEMEKLDHLGRKVLILKLHRFIFFGSAGMINEFIKGFIKEQKRVVEEENQSTASTTGRAGKASFFVLDFEEVEDIDHTALATFSELIHRMLTTEDQTTGGEGSGADGGGGGSTVGEFATPIVILTSLRPQLERILDSENIIASLLPRGNAKRERVFPTLDIGVEWVEDLLLERAAKVRNKWCAFDTFKRLHNQSRAYALNDASEHVLGVRLGSAVHRYVRAIRLPKGSCLFRRGDVDPSTYLLQRGRVSLYTKPKMDVNKSKSSSNGGIGEEDDTMVRLGERYRSLRRGAFLNSDALNTEDPLMACTHSAVADVDSILYSITSEDLIQLEQDNPGVALEFCHKVLADSVRTLRVMNRKQEALDFFVARGNGAKEDGASPDAFPASTRSPSPASSSPPMPSSPVNGNTSNGVRVASNKVMTKFVTPAKQALRRAADKFSDMPIIDESLVITGFKKDRSHAGKRSLLDVNASLNMGESTGKHLARELLEIETADHPLPSLQELKSRFEQIDIKLETDWNKVAHGASVIYPDEVARVFHVSRGEANEMVWEADAMGKGGISFVELLDALVAVDEAEIQIADVGQMD